ncbi:predicted protein [Plenodomus lingam JN3]|uniref:Predicted protein n=1 Tax=Leptosphaeria maculans (strain JN3 / isolate v23.1.3 / race Av1-4-5-6-7-8) TaxID=985895 RepID=E4ZP17_LEPMJ|nr:predicted protein [Plenodomus lingam JN3]CBX93386.1 predicted protein [Plenodomus lingam JN3]
MPSYAGADSLDSHTNSSSLESGMEIWIDVGWKVYSPIICCHELGVINMRLSTFRFLHQTAIIQLIRHSNQSLRITLPLAEICRCVGGVSHYDPMERVALALTSTLFIYAYTAVFIWPSTRIQHAAHNSEDSILLVEVVYPLLKEDEVTEIQIGNISWLRFMFSRDHAAARWQCASSVSTVPTPEQLATNNAFTLIAQNSTLFGVTVVIVSIRCYTRGVVLKSFGKDDWTILVSLLLATVTLICYAAQVPVGLGRPISVIRLDQDGYRTLLKFRMIHMTFITAGVTVVKISVSFTLLRLAVTERHRWFLYSLILFLLGFLVLCAGTIGSPMSSGGRDTGLETPAATHRIRYCHLYEYHNAAVTIATDFLLALLPIPFIWKLSLNLRTKLFLAIVLSLGLLASFAGIMKATKSLTILLDPNRFA